MVPEREKWYALSVRYASSEQMAGWLSNAGFELFLPPRVGGLIFVRSTYSLLQDFKTYTSAGQKLFCMRACATREPITVSDRAMSQFMEFCRTAEFPIVLLEPPKLKLGCKVRVIDGPFKGVEGRVVRMQKQKRVLMCLENALWAATEYIRQDLLEVLPEDEERDKPVN